MPKKERWFWQDWIEDVKTSRPLQLTLLTRTLGIIVVLVLLLVAWHVSHSWSEEAEAKKRQEEQELAARPAPNPIHFQSANDLQFADPKTGSPTIWYARTDTGYVLYDGPGFHSDGTALKPAQGAEIVAIKQWAEAQVEAVASAQKQQADQEKQAEATARVASLKSLFQFPSVQNQSATVVIGVDASSLTPALQNVFLSEFQKQLSPQYSSLTFENAVLLSGFYDGGYFEKTFSGDASILNDVDFFKQAKVLLLLKPTVEFKPSMVIDGMQVCTLTVSSCSYVASVTGRHQGSMVAVKPAYTQEAALTQATAALVEKDADRIQELLGEKP